MAELDEEQEQGQTFYQYSHLNYRLIALGLVVVLVLSGLIYDMVRTHYLREHLRRQLNQIAREAAQTYLPDDPAGARHFILTEAGKEKIALYPNSVMLDDQNPTLVKIKTYGEAYGYMAYPILLIVGSGGKLEFGAEGGAQASVENRGPIWEVPAEKVFLIIKRPKEWRQDQFLLFSPVDLEDPSSERIRYWSGLSGEKMVSVGGSVELLPADPAVMVPKARAAIEAGRSQKDAGVVYAALVDSKGGSSAVIVGFAALSVADVSPEGVVGGEFIRLLVDGDFDKTAAEKTVKGRTIQDFGLLHKGQVKVRNL